MRCVGQVNGELTVANNLGRLVRLGDLRDDCQIRNELASTPKIAGRGDAGQAEAGVCESMFSCGDQLRGAMEVT